MFVKGFSFNRDFFFFKNLYDISKAYCAKKKTIFYCFDNKNFFGKINISVLGSFFL